MEDGPRRDLDRLLRGVATDDVALVRDAWRALLGRPAAATPLVRKTLRSDAFRGRARGPLARYLGVLLMLLDELSREAFRDEVARLGRAGLHPAHRRTVALMARRLEDRPAGRVGPGVPVQVAPDLGEPGPIVARIARWGEVVGPDLKGVTRIDVIARDGELDYLGLYSILFSGIVLTWPREPGRGLVAWARYAKTELTLYHEVGHHALGHLEGGQIPEQEEEAEEYARRTLGRAHPVLRIVVRALFWPLAPWMGRRRRRRHHAA